MAWESSTHRCPLPSDQMTGGKGVGSIWVCDEGISVPGGCGRRWRIADLADEQVRWEPIADVGLARPVENYLRPSLAGW